MLAGPDGRLPEPLRKGLIPPTAEELADWASQQPGAEVLSDQGAQPMDATAAEEFYVRTWGGALARRERRRGRIAAAPEDGDSGRTAEANLSIRLAAGQKVEEIVPEVERLLREAARRRARSSRSTCGRPRRPGWCRPTRP